MPEQSFKHAESDFGDGRTLCGLANDAGDSGDADANPEYALSREVITCPDCRRVIAHVYNCFTPGHKVR